MTTPNEREARELLARELLAREYEYDGLSNIANEMREQPLDNRFDKRALRAIIAALTREQREGECPACGLAWGEHRLGYAASSCKVKPQQEAPGAVAMWRAMTASGKWMYFDHEPTHMSNYQRLYTTPPAPVDVRLLRELAERWKRLSRYEDENGESEVGDADAYRLKTCAKELLALLDGQQAGVECRWAGAMRGDGKCPQCSQYHALGGGERKEKEKIAQSSKPFLLG